MIEIYDRKFKRTAFIIFILFKPHDLYGINYITFCLETVVVWGIVIWILWFAITTNNPSCICAYNICLISLMHLLFVLSFTSLITVRTAVSATFKPRPTDPNYISYSFKRNNQRVRPQGVFFFFLIKRANLWNKSISILQFLHHGYCICLVYCIRSARMWVS